MSSKLQFCFKAACQRARSNASIVVDEGSFIQAVLSEPGFCESRALARLDFAFSSEDGPPNEIAVEEMSFSPGLTSALARSWADAQHRGCLRVELSDFLQILLEQSQGTEKLSKRFSTILNQLNQVPTTHWLPKPGNVPVALIGAELEEVVEMIFESFQVVSPCLKAADLRLSAELTYNFETLMDRLGLKPLGKKTPEADLPSDERIWALRLAQFIQAIDLLEPVARSSGHRALLDSVRRSAFQIHDDFVLKGLSGSDWV